MPRRSCREVFQEANIFNTPHYINVDYATGRALNNWIDSLSASFAGVQVTCVLDYNIQEFRPQYRPYMEVSCHITKDTEQTITMLSSPEPGKLLQHF